MAEKWKGIYRAGGFPILAVILASCGGGGDGPGACFSPTGAVCSAVGVDRSLPEPLLSAGLYKGISSDGRAVTSLVLDDNSFYTVYSAVNSPSIVGGAVHGTARTEGTAGTDTGTFSSTDAVGSSADVIGKQLAAVTGTYRTKQLLSGGIAYAGLAQSVSFSANYSGNFELTPGMSTIAGNYSGSYAMGMGAEAATFEIGENGTISGRSTSGCTLSGTIQQGASDRPYAVTVTFGGFPCRLPGATASGISYFDRTSNTIYAVGSIPGQNTEMVAIGTKQ
jgi:hypothetical protein